MAISISTARRKRPFPTPVSYTHLDVYKRQAWEVDYPAWNDIFDAFCHVLTQMNAEMADSVLLDEMVYLIARANEAEGFIQETTSHPKWFECLCRRATASNKNEAKWQFAAYLPECSCSQKVRDIILDFAKDPNEYAVSYTHLDVYKRQDLHGPAGYSGCTPGQCDPKRSPD